MCLHCLKIIYVDTLGKGAENQNGNLRWHLPGGGGGQGSLLFSKLEFSIKPDLRGLSFS